ncbi:hypothetical protein B0H13DRAFT_1972641 [Mycena leptocephala]|nr:hypothetical protein B0H13DRAFT_1972641 [Mycena leptocephala]
MDDMTFPEEVLASSLPLTELAFRLIYSPAHAPCTQLVFGVGFCLACPFLIPIDPRCRLFAQVRVIDFG